MSGVDTDRRGALLTRDAHPMSSTAQLAALASREETLRALETILADPNHPHFIQALKFAADRGYGRPNHDVSLDVPAVVLVAPGKLSTDEWMDRYGGLNGSLEPPLLAHEIAGQRGT